MLEAIVTTSCFGLIIGLVMHFKKITNVDTPYEGVSEADYQIEKHRLQLEILRIQKRIIQENRRLVIVFEGRDAAGKGSTIKRFIENMIPSSCNIVALGIPTPKESKNWFNRYEKNLPKPGSITFFDRSWYSRALIEPTMGYCSKSQYKYFMSKVLNWEHKLIEQEDILLVKIYLSVDKEAQLFRFENRLDNPLAYWKFSENDLKAREKWELFTRFKEQMFTHASSEKSPWVVINANKKREARLTAMLHIVRLLGKKKFETLTGEDVTKSYSIKIGGVKFRGLSSQQHAVLEELKEQESYFIDLDDKADFK
jgi:polyphosphate kinase 2